MQIKWKVLIFNNLDKASSKDSQMHDRVRCTPATTMTWTGRRSVGIARSHMEVIKMLGTAKLWVDIKLYDG